MAPPKKRVLCEWEKNVVEAACASSQQEVMDSSSKSNFGLHIPPVVTSKRVCPHCKREFKNGKGLGGHIKIHFKDRRTRSSKSRLRQNILSLVTRSRRRNQQQTKRRNRGGGDGSVENMVVDLSKSLHGCGWKTQKKRDTNKIVAFHEQDYDSCSDHDEEEELILEKLRRCGFTGTAHRISRTRRLYMCNTCDVYMPTFHAVLGHVNDGSCSTSIAVSMEVDQVALQENREAGAEAFVEVANVDDGVTRENGSIDQNVSNLDPPERLDFDLNEMPPEED